jgi:hypothetical protein
MRVLGPACTGSAGGFGDRDRNRNRDSNDNSYGNGATHGNGDRWPNALTT